MSMRHLRGPLVVWAITLGLAGCTGGTARVLSATAAATAATVEPTIAGASTAPTRTLPSNAERTCRAVVVLRPYCPSLAPPALGRMTSSAFRQGKHWTFTAQAGVDHGDPTIDRPPSFMHLVVQAGDLSDVFETFTYSRSQRTAAVDGLLSDPERLRLARLGSSGETPQGLYLGAVSWGQHPGELVLAPPFEFADSIHAGHLLFVSRDPAAAYIVSLHSWEPFLDTVATLRRVLESPPFT